MVIHGTMLLYPTKMKNVFFTPEILQEIASTGAINILWRGSAKADSEIDTLDDYVSLKGIRSPDAIKIDTQGSELDILRAAKKCLKSCKLLMMEQPILPYNQGAPSFDQYMAIALSNGFIPVGLEEMHIIDGAFVQIDVLFARKDIYERRFMRYGFLKSAITSFSDTNSKLTSF